MARADHDRRESRRATRPAGGAGAGGFQVEVVAGNAMAVSDSDFQKPRTCSPNDHCHGVALVISRATLVALLCALSAGCARKAPGPDECRGYALSLFGLRSETDLGAGTHSELALRDRVDEITRECLVLPYDRELLRCVEETGRASACRAAFKSRRAQHAERRLSR